MPNDSPGRPGPATVRIRVLGSVSLAADGDVEPAVLGPRLRRLLAALATRPNAVVSVDTLADVVWGDDPPATPDAAMHTLVSRLRAALRATDPAGNGGASTTVLTRAPGYVLSVAPGDLDATRFELLARQGRSAADDDPAAAAACFAEALALWRGRAYAEFADEDFARPEAARLDGLRATVVEDYADALLGLGRPEDAVPLLEGLVADEPLRERARSQLMLAEYRRGRQAEALGTFRAYREQLAEELGIDPSPSLQRLQEDILRQDPHLDAPPAPLETPTRVETRPGARNPEARGNLPSTPPTLIGRDADLATLAETLRPGELLTLTGPGGVGKTSMALRLAHDLSGSFPDGVWFCDLSSLSAADDLPLAVMSALDLQAAAGTDGASNLVTFLRAKRLLLVLDNCEHVLAPAAALAHATHHECREVAILATSRAPLEVADERVWPVPPLSVPSRGALSVDAARVAEAPAVQLFVERTRRRVESFELGDLNAEAVAEICRRLDGLPLAIELAAARMGAITPGDLADRLSWRFRLLHGGARSGSERHRTLRALVDWSFDLLDEEHRRVFEVLSLFAGGFDLEDAERLVLAVPELGSLTDGALTDGALTDGALTDGALTDGALVDEALTDGALVDEALVDDIVLGLVDRSMVAVSPNGPRTSYALLETLRAYGKQHLDARPYAVSAHHAHAQLIADLTAAAASRLYGPGHVAASTEISGYLDELRAAHAWSLAHDLELAARLVGSLMLYVEHRMQVEVPQWAERTLKAAADAPSGPPAGLADVYAVAAAGARFTGDLLHAAQLAERGLQLPGEPMTAAYLRMMLAEVALFEGRLEEVEHQHSEIAALAERADLGPVTLLKDLLLPLVTAYSGEGADRSRAAADVAEEIELRAARLGAGPVEAWARYLRGEALLDTDPEAAAELLDGALQLARGQGDRYASGVAMVSAASVRARHGDPHQAVPLFREVVEHWAAVGDWTHQWTSLRGVVDVLLRLERDEDAAVLRGALVSRAQAAPIFGRDAERMAEAETLLRQRLGDDPFTDLSDRGARMDDDDVVSFTRTALTQE